MDFHKLPVIREFLRTESNSRVIQTREHQLYECISRCTGDILCRTPYHSPGCPNATICLRELVKPALLQDEVVNLLTKHSKQFQSVLDMLVDNVHIQGNDGNGNQLYDMVLSDIKRGSNHQIYIKLLLYAVATCINTPLYILLTNETGKLHWVFYEPLFSFEEQPKHCINYITMYMSPLKTFYPIDQHDVVGQEKPTATGQLGMYLDILKDIPVVEIDVPDVLLTVSTRDKGNICQMCDQTVVRQCCDLFRELDIVDEATLSTILTTHRTRRGYLTTFQQLAEQSEPVFKIICQVLIHRHEKRILSSYVGDWKTFVSSCKHLKQFEALVELDDAVYNRNVVVSNFAMSCQQGGSKIDERRKTVTTAVIASSSAGIVSGGLIIAGIALAPATFATSLGLSIAGGAIGVGSGIAAGTARVIEVKKQSNDLKHIEEQNTNMKEKERAVASALHDVETVFETFIRNNEEMENENFGDSRRGVLAVGYALRASHGGVGIGIVATRLAASTAALSAAILGPLSMVIDIAFLVEAAHNKATGDKTNSGEKLRSAAEIIETKSKIFNSMLRGNHENTSKMINY